MHLIRHGQSEFNLHFTHSRRDPGIVDPRLTATGLDQARQAGLALRSAGLTRILVSPYTRALQTAAAIAAETGARVDITPLVRERYAFTCDIGTARSALARDWPAHDFAAVEEVWWPDAFEPEHAVIDRAARFRAAMRADPEAATTLLVSHWGFLLALTGQSMANGELLSWNPHAPAPEEIEWI
jgi:broad specificity phosphatase PhoE